MKLHDNGQNRQDQPPPGTEPVAETARSGAWEMIEPGRYQPRRIRGSLRGRELG
jgi:hypothetical protein